MEESNQFVVKQIVWAKVSNYPWWPARIVSSLSQQHRKLYKVNFFGDPTYCYLEGKHLLNFAQGLIRSKHQSDDFKLEKPLQLAKAAIKKMKGQIQKSQPVTLIVKEPSVMVESVPECMDQVKVQQKCFEKKIEKEDVESSCRFQESSSTHPEVSIEQITTDNVVDILSGSSFRCLLLLKGYNNRKQFRSINQKLKTKLLEKYDLSTIQPVRPSQHSRMPSSPSKTKIITKFKYKRSKNNIQHQCVQKLYKLLKKKNNSQNNRKIVLELMQRLPVYENNKKKFYQMYKSCVMWVNTQDHQFQDQYKKEDEQRTKLTQLD